MGEELRPLLHSRDKRDCLGQGTAARATERIPIDLVACQPKFKEDEVLERGAEWGREEQNGGGGEWGRRSRMRGEEQNEEGQNREKDSS